MRKSFIDTNEASTHDDVAIMCPWSAVIVPVCGGWIAFESVSDYGVWLAQV